MSSRCWNWLGAKHERGYGRFNISVNGKQKYVSAHRAAYELATGKHPGKQEVMHSCDNPSCCNPSHLSVGTHQDNMTDMKEKGRAKFLVGSDNNKTKLTEDDVRNIRREAVNGGYGINAKLAREYGVSKVNIGHILNFKTWKHVSN